MDPRMMDPLGLLLDLMEPLLDPWGSLVDPLGPLVNPLDLLVDPLVLLLQPSPWSAMSMISALMVSVQRFSPDCLVCMNCFDLICIWSFLFGSDLDLFFYLDIEACVFIKT